MASSDPDKLISKADKLTKLSLTRWTADWKTATGLYEQAAALAKELGKWSEVADFYRRASELYTECGRSQPASDALAKGARALEDSSPDVAIQLYIDSSAILEEDGKEQMAFDLYRAATSVYIRLEKYTDAATILLRWALAADKSNATHSQCKARILKILFNRFILKKTSAIIVHLYAHDFQQAEKCHNDCCQVEAFLYSDQNRAATKLISAYTDGNVEEIKLAAQSSIISNLDHMIVRIARKLPTGDVSRLKSTTEEQEEPLDEDDLT
ncbi:hypothetical protein F511_16373 [Dorcoceras hygrometricum]|uniref:Gamma-soluble NSF attachment protein n=1 Tax=Dorcoceras hygrometricum TaxID=472368 RepID=A0A2Z7AQP1_9LAMI|nr:hypothetical protein F511_16373 [Dorcoceras hygrometricum]